MAKKHAGKHEKSNRSLRANPMLPLVGFSEIPLREVSGLAVASLPQGRFLAAVGDHGPNVALALIVEGPGGPLGAWNDIDLSQLETPDGAARVEQAEAVATDGSQQAMVLIEDPALLLVLDTAARRLTYAFALDSSGHDGLDDSWRDDPASRGEGMVLMRDGHVLVVKEKRPPGLIEFGPQGDEPIGVSARTLHPLGEAWTPRGGGRLLALAWWPAPVELDDLSDAEIGPDGELYLLSDQSNAVAQLRTPLEVGESAAYVAVWSLPTEVQKAEGLTFLPDGTALVAVDMRSVGRNLATLPPLDQWPRT
jgi:hypothetical protein